MTSRCFCCGKPNRFQEPFHEVDDMFDTGTYTYCGRCWEAEGESLAHWLEFIDDCGGVQGVPERKMEYGAWTGSYVNGRLLAWTEIVEEYIEHVARREGAT